jgi:reactive intermediate/imine deaminase
MEHAYMKRQVGRGKGHYSKAVVANGMVFVSGILPIKHFEDGSSIKMTTASFEEQAQYVLERLKSTLEDSGSALRKLVSVRVYVDDISNWTTFNEIYAKFLGDDNRPARAVVPVPELHYGLKIELEAVSMY